MTRVYHRERAAGVDARLIAFLDWWDANGQWDIVVDPKGGVRTDEALQLELYYEKRSRARTLADTPHGRAGAIDCHPCIVVNGVVVALRDKEVGLYVLYGKAGEAQGLIWGGHFHTIFDGPHLEVPGWQHLPFPPLKKEQAHG